MDQLYLAAITLMAVLAVVAALSPKFHDTFTQCLGLGLIAVGGGTEAASRAFADLGAPRAHLLLLVGAVVYGIGTLIAQYRTRRDA